MSESFYICVLKQATLTVLVITLLLNIAVGTKAENDRDIAIESRSDCGGYRNRTITLAGCTNNCNVTVDKMYSLDVEAFFSLTKNYTGLVYDLTARRNNEVITVYRRVKSGLFQGNQTLSESLPLTFSNTQFRNKSGQWIFKVTLTPSNSSEIFLCESFPIQIKASNKTYSESCTPAANIDECAPLVCRPTSESSVQYSCQCDEGSEIYEGDKQGGSCKKVPGTLCSPYVPFNECITNAECQAYNDHYYNCQCKTGYKIATNQKACISETNTDGGGASTLLVSVLGLQIMTLMSVFSVFSTVFFT